MYTHDDAENEILSRVFLFEKYKKFTKNYKRTLDEYVLENLSKVAEKIEVSLDALIESEKTWMVSYNLRDDGEISMTIDSPGSSITCILHPVVIERIAERIKKNYETS